MITTATPVMKPATSGGAGPETPAPPESPNPANPTPQNNSAFRIAGGQNSEFPPPSSPSPADVLKYLQDPEHDPLAIAARFGLTLPQLQSYLDSPDFQAYLQLVQSIERIRGQTRLDEYVRYALTTLAALTDRAPYETARRAANTLLIIAGVLPSPKTASKPWDPTQKDAITKQHMPTYSTSPPRLRGPSSLHAFVFPPVTPAVSAPPQ